MTCTICGTTQQVPRNAGRFDCENCKVAWQFAKCEACNEIEGFRALEPAGTFYVFPNVAPVCNRLGITSHGLAMFLLEGADEKFGVACLGGECFGVAGAGFLRFSCAEPDERLAEAVQFLADAVTRADRVRRYLEAHPEYRGEPAA